MSPVPDHDLIDNFLDIAAVLANYADKGHPVPHEVFDKSVRSQERTQYGTLERSC